MQTGKHAANVGSRLKLAWKPGRRHLKSQPSSRIGENPPYGMIGGIEETSASFEARSAPRSYPTAALHDGPTTKSLLLLLRVRAAEDGPLAAFSARADLVLGERWGNRPAACG